MTEMTNPAHAFAANRAEESGHDLWRTFVIPPFFHDLALDKVRRPLVIEGGRGCGKTSLLRYLCHRTQLSLNRDLTNANVPRQLGLYLRADTQFLRTFRGDWLAQDEWVQVFSHALALMLLAELLDAVCLLGKTPERRAAFPGVDTLNFGFLASLDPSFPATLTDLQGDVDSRRNALEMWMNNPDLCSRPRILPLKSLLLLVIRSLRLQVPALMGTDVFVFVDEYENLLDYQMRVINTLLKHSEPPLIFHIAAKRNSMTVRQTLGAEQLQEREDYRKIDIEERLESNFSLFAAELFFFRLAGERIEGLDIPVDPAKLSDVSCLPERFFNQAYRDRVLGAVNRIFPTLNRPQIADHIFRDTALHARLRDSLAEALKAIEPGFPLDRLMRQDVPVASVCTLPLLYQKKRPSDLARELELYAAGLPSKFVSADWEHHYFLATVLYLYLPLQRPCIAYAGFETFVKLSCNNLRHFIELCYVSLSEVDIAGMVRGVPPQAQAKAARAASSIFFKETKGAGDHGPRLHQIVSTLGQIFRLSQQRPSQSEAERTHFSITHGSPSPQTELLLRECEKWSVLFAERETKVKGSRLHGVEYVLNPIFAPYFGISFNKGRRLEIPCGSVEVIFTGDGDRLDQLLRDYTRSWKLGASDQLALW